MGMDASAGVEDVRITMRELSKVYETTVTTKRRETLLLILPGRVPTAVEIIYSLTLRSSQKQARRMHDSHSPQSI